MGFERAIAASGDFEVMASGGELIPATTGCVGNERRLIFSRERRGDSIARRAVAERDVQAARRLSLSWRGGGGQFVATVTQSCDGKNDCAENEEYPASKFSTEHCAQRNW